MPTEKLPLSVGLPVGPAHNVVGLAPGIRQQLISVPLCLGGKLVRLRAGVGLLCFEGCKILICRRLRVLKHMVQAQRSLGQ